jgi:hypothetical protein
MAFPSSGGTTRSLGDVWRLVRGLAANVKAQAVGLRAGAAAGPVSAGRVLEFLDELANAKARFEEAAAISGLAAYAQEQIGNPALNVAQEFASMLAQVDATIAWGAANLPAQGGFLSVLTLPASGVYTWRSFSVAETAGLRVRLDALIATID